MMDFLTFFYNTPFLVLFTDKYTPLKLVERIFSWSISHENTWRQSYFKMTAPCVGEKFSQKKVEKITKSGEHILTWNPLIFVNSLR